VMSSVDCVNAIAREQELSERQKDWVRQGFKDQRLSHEKYGKEAKQKQQEAKSYGQKPKKKSSHWEE
jgi:hypothetical protein